ncbi:MAG: hypothetical protein C3F06_08775 [Candidatus Methanoperedenaceae archaeon]|nr:MAG: hypothetical protein C3F06_08775 [Candidatus Methanoperedenaceae archaeon]
MDFIAKRVIAITLIIKALVFLSLFLMYPVLAADTNLAANPGFESGTTAPLNWTFVSQDENTPVWSNISHSGSKSIEINIPGSTDLNSGFAESDSISAQPFTEYTFSAWGKTQGVGGTNPPTVRLGELDANRNLLRLTSLPLFNRGTNEWEQRTLEFQTGSNTAYIYIYANIWGGYGTFWMDDVTISLKTNLALNPGFENGTTAPMNWTFVRQDGNIPIWSNISHNGSKSVEIDIPGTIDHISGYPESDRISAQPFTAYKFSAWGKTLDVNGTNIPTITFGELDADKILLRLTNLPLFGRGTNDWEQKILEFQTGANTSYIYFYFNIWGGYGTFWMDDVTLSLSSTTPIPTTTPLPEPTLLPTPLPTPLPSSCSYIIYTDGKTVYAKKVGTGNIEFSGTFNEVLSFTAKSGNRVCIKNGDYSLSTITLQPNVVIECESSNAIIKAADVFYLISLKSDSTIRGCTFDHKGKTKTIYVSGDVKNWHVENNYFINSDIAVLVENLKAGFPISGYGYIVNNKGLYSKLGTLQGTRNITVTGNSFSDREGPEFFDFNYNVHYVLFENNTFINADGYSIIEEAIDMVGGDGYSNSYNIVRNNKIIANFQSGIRPSKSAIYNTIENNYIEFKKGKVTNIAGIYLYGGGSDTSTPNHNQVIKNTIIGGKSGIELSGADDNFVTENIISGSDRGISLVKDSFYGANVAPKNNIISKNVIYNINYGIYISSSPNNVVTNNVINNYKITDIFGQ